MNTVNKAEPQTLDIGAIVWYRHKEYKVILKNPQGLYMIKRHSDVRWVHPRNVMPKA